MSFLIGGMAKFDSRRFKFLSLFLIGLCDHPSRTALALGMWVVRRGSS